MSPMIDPFEKVNDITSAWEAHAPQSTFSGFTLEKFKETVQPHLDVRDQLADLETRAMGLRAKRASGAPSSRAAVIPLGCNAAPQALRSRAMASVK